MSLFSPSLLDSDGGYRTVGVLFCVCGEANNSQWLSIHEEEFHEEEEDVTEQEVTQFLVSTGQ